MSKTNVCDQCGTKLGEIACGNKYGGSFCSVNCADIAEMFVKSERTNNEVVAAEPPKTTEEIIANLVRRVSKLEEHREMQARENRLLYEQIEGVKTDIETWAREVEKIRQTADTAESNLDDLASRQREYLRRINQPKQITLDVDVLAKLIGGVSK